MMDHLKHQGPMGSNPIRWSPWPKGKPRPDEDKEKISRGKKGLVPSPEHRRAISEGRKKQEAEKRKQKEEKK